MIQFAKPAKAQPSSMQLIPIAALAEHPDNPRGELSAEEMQSLVITVREHGILQPLIVREAGHATYQVIGGACRLRAAIEAGLTDVPCVVRKADDQSALEIMLIENVARNNLNPIEIGRLLWKMYGEGDAPPSLSRKCKAKTHEEIAAIFGQSTFWVSIHIGLLLLPDSLQRRVTAGELPIMAAKRIVPHAGNAEFLKRIEADMDRNPWAWQTAETAVQSIKAMQEKMNLKPNRNPHAFRKNRPGNQGNSRTTSNPRTDGPTRANEGHDPDATSRLADEVLAALKPKASGVGTEARRLMIEEIISAINELETIDELDQVAKALMQRQRKISPQ